MWFYLFWLLFIVFGVCLYIGWNWFQYIVNSSEERFADIRDILDNLAQRFHEILEKEMIFDDPKIRKLAEFLIAAAEEVQKAIDLTDEDYDDEEFDPEEEVENLADVEVYLEDLPKKMERQYGELPSEIRDIIYKTQQGLNNLRNKLEEQEGVDAEATEKYQEILQRAVDRSS